MAGNFNEKRKSVRVGFETRITLRTHDSEISLQGSSRDLGLKGIFVKTGEDIAVGTPCQSEITLSGVSEIDLLIQGTVARRTPSGLGIAFDSMDLDTYAHLKNIIRYNSENPDAVN